MTTFRSRRAERGSRAPRAAGAPLVLLAAVAVTCASACGRGPCGRDAFDRAVATATSSAGPWRSASVRVAYSPARNRGNGSYYESEVAHSLVVEGTRPTLSVSMDSTRPARDELCAQPFALSFSPDGLVLAVSRDGGRSWSYAGLEGGSILYRRAPVVTAQPWAPGTSTKQLAIDALGAPQRLPSSALAPGVRVEMSTEELETAARFACARLGEPELRAALADALAHLSTWLLIPGAPVAPTLVCSADASRRDPAWRTVVQSALASLARDPAGRRVLEPYAAGCHGGVEGPGDDALWCLAWAALAAPPR